MHITMNRFEVANDDQKQFEQSITEHYEQLEGTQGYLSFHLIRGGTNGTVTYYLSHTKWANKEDFLQCDGAVQYLGINSKGMKFGRGMIKTPFLLDKISSYLKNFFTRANVLRYLGLR